MKKILSIIWLTLCAFSTVFASGSKSVQFSDMLGREIKLEEAAHRIVSLTASNCEILYAIGAGDTLIGRGTYCDYPLEVKEKPEVASGRNTNIEQIIALDPQVVVMSSMAQTEEQIKAIEKAGIAVVVTDADDIEGVYSAIHLLGKLTGKEKEAETVVDQMKASFAKVKAMSDLTAEETVYFEVSPLEYGLWTAGAGTFMDELATMAGLKNAFGDVEGWAEISQEKVIERDPDYIITSAMYDGSGLKPSEEILGRAEWQEMKAIRNGAVLSVDSNEITRPGPRLADAALTLWEFTQEKRLELKNKK